jgi:hypothetical protein
MKEELRKTRQTEAGTVSDQDRKTKRKPESAYRRLRYELSKTWARGPLLRLRHRGFNSADVFFGSYPRSGSTWSRFTIFEILTGQEATFEAVRAAFRGLGSHSKAPPLLPGGGRFLSTHEMYQSEYKKAMYLDLGSVTFRRGWTPRSRHPRTCCWFDLKICVEIRSKSSVALPTFWA